MIANKCNVCGIQSNPSNLKIFGSVCSKECFRLQEFKKIMVSQYLEKFYKRPEEKSHE